jgi:DNA polymerase-3 subunit epsilon
MNLLIVDTETTGLTPVDARCIEVGGILFSVDERAVLGQCSFLLPTDENPVAHINGIRAELTKRPQAARSGMEYFYAMAKQADYVVAHNAEFDKQWFGQGPLPVLPQQWICTMEDVEWPRVSRSRPAVTHLALAYGVPVWAAHRALTDCIYLAQVMEREPDLELLLTTALEPKRLYMAMVSYEDRQKAKDAGFRWDGEQRRWLRKMRESKVTELAFGVREVAA